MVEEKITIGKDLVLKSRLIMPPMATKKAENGQLNDDLIAYYSEHAKNPNFGLIITEHAYIDVQGKSNSNQISFASDDVIPNQQKLVQSVKSVQPDIKIFAQLNHAGFQTSTKITGREVVSASEFDGRSRSLSIDEIHLIQQKFAFAASRVKKAGYDGVEIHCAHGYLLNQFYSPLTNYRIDDYGPETLNSRLRFLTETISEVKKEVGDDFPISVRFGGCDFQYGGSTIEDAVQSSRILERAGVSLLNLSGGMCGYIRQNHEESGYFKDMTAEVKKHVKIPVVLTGGIWAIEDADILLKSHKADLIGIGRAFMYNTKWGLH